MNMQLVILEAISLRNKIDQGLLSKEQTREAVVGLIGQDLWSDGHIASIIRYKRPRVWQIAREIDAPRGARGLGGGTLPRESLDLILELSGAKGELTDQHRAILRAALEMGTSSRLLSKLTGISIGAILYVQRNMKDRKVKPRARDEGVSE